MILNRINKEIDVEFNNRRRSAMNLLETRKLEIYSLMPSVKQTDEYMSMLGILLCYRAMNKKPSEFIMGKLPTQYINMNCDEIKAEIKELEELKENLLFSKGYPKDYLNNSFECEKCKDTGYKTQSDGKIISCTCRNDIYSQKLKELSGVNTKDIFENFNINYYSEDVNKELYGINVSPKEQMRGAFRRCVLFVEEFENKKISNMVFVGKSGLGKTFLANCIINSLTDKGYSCLYLSATELFKYFAPGFYGRDDCSEYVDFILNCNLLVIDDLGSEKQTETRYAELLDILNKREANNKTKLCKTIITTNLMPAEIRKNYDERVFSRIYGDYDLLRFAGADIRFIKKQGI